MILFSARIQAASHAGFLAGLSTEDLIDYMLDEPPLMKKKRFRRKRFISSKFTDRELADFYSGMITY